VLANEYYSLALGVLHTRAFGIIAWLGLAGFLEENQARLKTQALIL